MIFVAFGTSLPFPRLFQRLHFLAPQLKEELVIQAGKTQGKIPNAKIFQYAPDLREYYQQARLVIVHAGLGIQLELIEMHKPFIAVPRLAKYGEHNDDHQLETCEMISAKYGIKYITDLNDLTIELLESYTFTPDYSNHSLLKFRREISSILSS